MAKQIYFLFFYIVAFLVILTVSELLYKRVKISSEITRKISHLVSTLTSISFLYVFDSHWFVFSLAVLSFLLLFIGKLKHSFGSIENVSRQTMGSYLLPVGIYLSFLISESFGKPIVFMLPMLILAISDTSAGIIGLVYQLNGRNISVWRWVPAKSYAGSFTFLFTALVISYVTFVFYGYDFPEIVLLTLYISFTATIIELISPFGSDNLSIPLVISLILAYLT